MLSDTLRLVRTINCYDAMTIRQVLRRFHLSENSYTSCSDRLAKLASKEQLLSQKLIPHPTKLRGGASAVYVVGPEGRKMLRADGAEVKRPKFERGSGISDHNWHSFWVNDILISAHLWADATPGVRIAAKMTDFDFKRDKRFPYKVTGLDGKTEKTEMDGLLAIKREREVGKDKQYLLELETGSNEPAAFRRKIHNLVLFTAQFEKVFGTRLFSGYLFFATATYGLKQGTPRYESPDEQRKVLLREIAVTLRNMDAVELAPLFRVTACPPDSLDLFTRPVWYFPGYYDPFRLFVDLG